MALWLDTEAAKGALAVRETVEKDYGRIEIRRYVFGDNSKDSLRIRKLRFCDASPQPD